jgi:hypothetical protein
MVVTMSSWPRPVAAMADAPRPPVRKTSTIETSRWKRDESRTGRERRSTLRLIETGFEEVNKVRRADNYITSFKKLKTASFADSLTDN